MKHLADIICITETWQYQQYAEYTPILLATSTPTSRSPKKRGNGGVAILTRPGFQQHCQVLHKTTHSLTVKVKTHVLHLIYLPPSMPWDTCRPFLPQQKITVLLGDLNCHPNPTRTISALLNNRRDTLMAICLQHQLKWITDTNEFRHDHLLVEHHCPASVESRPPISHKTDHLMLYATLSPKPPIHQSSSQTIRYNLKFLDNPTISERLCHTFDTLWRSQQHLFTALSQHILRSTDLQPLIDTYYDIYITLLKSCCETTLGTYVIQEKNKTLINPFLS
jgi:hypothetical protein